MTKKFVTVGLDFGKGKILYQGPNEYEAVKTGMTANGIDVKMYSIEDVGDVVTLGIYHLKEANLRPRLERAGISPEEASKVFTIGTPVEVHIPRNALEALFK